MKIGFIGFGNMAQALADGLIFKEAVRPEQIHACAVNWEKLCSNTEPKGFIPCRDSAALVEHSDMVVIAVKPHLVEEVVAPVREGLKGKILISVAAGFPFDRYEEILVPDTHHLSVMPNTPVSVGEGIILCESKHSLTEEEYRSFSDLFSRIARIETVETKSFGIAGTISGCGPAFASMFLEALADAGVLHGLPRDLSYTLASQMLVGTGKLQLRTNAHPGVMKDAVCSPGGTTIVGVAALERKGLRSAVIDAVDAIQARRNS